MKIKFVALGAFLMALVLLLMGAAAPAPIQRNQFSTNIVGVLVKGAVGFDSTANITGASAHGGTATFTNGTVNQGTAKITGETDVGGTLIVTNIAQMNNLVVTNNGTMAFATNTTAPDVFLMRDNRPNILAQRNGAVAQTNRVYNTFTDDSNYERTEISWSGNIATLGVFGAGTGSNNRPLTIAAGSMFFTINTAGAYFGINRTSDKWDIGTTGDFITGADGVGSIGLTNANRPGIMYLSRGLVIGPNNGGGFLTNILTARAVLDFPSTAASTSSDLSIAVTGATTNDVASVQAPPVVQLANGAFTCFASNNTVYVRFMNYQTVGALDPGAASFSVLVNRF